MNQLSWADVEKQFWDTVQRLLTETYRCSEYEARNGIATYQHEIERHGFAEAVYNQGEERTAEVVDSVIRTGLPVIVPR